MSSSHTIGFDRYERYRPVSGPQNLTANELQEKLRQYGVSEETVDAFRKKRVTGRSFMTLDKKMIKDLNITDDKDIRKLEKLYQDLKIRI